MKLTSYNTRFSITAGNKTYFLLVSFFSSFLKYLACSFLRTLNVSSEGKIEVKQRNHAK